RSSGSNADASREPEKHDVIVWFPPSPEVVAALPERVRTQLGLEMAAVEQMKNADSSAVINKLAPIAGEQPYFDIFRTAAGAVESTTLAPNPAHERTTLSYHLGERRAVTITLHSIDGRHLREMIPSS